MKRSLWLRRTAAVTALALAAAACAADDNDVDEPVDDDVEVPDDDDDDAAAPEGDGTLLFGYILPESGPLAFLGPPQIEAVNLAIADINAAGGVLGNDVSVLSGDEAGDVGVAAEEASRLIGEGVDVILGAAASGMSLAFVDAVTDAGVLQCSGSNTAPTFTNNDYNGLYTRTAPTDALQGPVLAELIVGDGNSAPALLARADDYGQGLLDATEAALVESGATIAFAETYDPEAQTFADIVDAVAGSGADSVVVIAFDEGAQILSDLIEAGLGPDDFPVYGADGVASDDLAETVDPGDASVLDGMRGTRPSPQANPDFIDRFQEESGLSDTTFAPQIYDCVTIVALAAEIAQSDVGSDIVQEMEGVTSTGGTECNDFASCKEALDAGDEITYQAASGVVLGATDTGNLEPTSGIYETWEIDAEGAIVGIEEIEANF